MRLEDERGRLASPTATVRAVHPQTWPGRDWPAGEYPVNMRSLSEIAQITFVAALDFFAFSLLLAVWVARRPRVIADFRRLMAALRRMLR